MAVKYTETNNFNFVNTWTQLKDAVSQKRLFSESDYQALTALQKENYILALYKNSEALENRINSDYTSEYGDTQTRYSWIISNSSEIDRQQFASTEEGKAYLNAEFDKQFNSALANDVDMNKPWMNELVSTQYGGDYAKFLSDYSGDDGYNKLLLAQLPSASDVTEESFSEDMSALSNAYEEQRYEYDTSQNEAYNNVQQYIKEMLKTNARKETYENATALEKTLNTLWQLPAAWVAELGNLVEGAIDTIAATTVGLIDLFGGNTGTPEFIAKDIIALDTAVLNATDASWLSIYAEDNVAKWAHEIGVNIVDMVPLAIPVAGQAIYYGISLGRTLEGELQAGYDYSDAWVYAHASTAIEYATETISDSPFFKRGKTMVGKWLDNTTLATKVNTWYSKNKNWATEIVRQSFGEGLEEVVSGVASGIMHGVIAGDFQLEGKDLFRSFLVGGLVGGIMAGGNSFYRHAIINNTQIKLIDANGSSIDISVGKAQLVSDYVKTVTEKVKAGKILSQKEQERYNVLKDIKINAFLDRAGNVLAGSENMTFADAIAASTATSYRISTEAGHFDKINKTETITPEDEFEKKVAELKDKASTMPTSDQFELTNIDNDKIAEAYNLTSDKDIEKAKTDFVTNAVITLGKMSKMFGNDVILSGIEGYAKLQDKTLDEVVSLLSVGSKQSSLNIVKDGNAVASLKNNFKNADFVVVEPKKGSDVYTKFQSLNETVTAIKSVLRKMESYAFNGNFNVKLFATTGETVSTSFFVDNTLYLNANWIMSRDTDFIKDTIALKALTQNAMLSIKANSTRQILQDIINKLDLKNRSSNIVMQEMMAVLLFTKNNPLMQQLLAMTESKSDRDALIKYFADLRYNFANNYITKTAGSALSNMSVSAEMLFDTENTDIEDPSLSLDDIINKYIQNDFRAFPGITGNQGIPVEMSKLNTMYLHFKNVFGFNKELDLSQNIDWLNEFSNPDNYSAEGYIKLKTELEKYQTVHNSGDYEFGSIVTTKPFNELLNYYLDQFCGLIITHKGVLSSNDFITKVLDMGKVDLKLSAYDTSNISRKPVGKVRDFATTFGSHHLPKEVLNADIYLQSNSSANEVACVNGTPGTGMQIFMNIAKRDVVNKQNEKDAKIIGGAQIVLDDKTGLPIEKDGKYKVENYELPVSNFAIAFAHEVGHAIAMSLDLQGTFNERMILQAWTTAINDMSVIDRVSFATSVIDWLYDGTDLKTDKVYFNTLFTGDRTEQDWRTEFMRAITNSNTNTETLTTYLKPLARYLYLTGYAHEMYANGKVSSMVREDLIQSSVKSDKKSATVVLYLSEAYKKAAPNFLRVLDGYTSTRPVTTFRQVIEQIISSPENVTNRLYSRIQNIEELKAEFGVEFDKDLVNPDFWSGKLNAARINFDEFASRESLINDIESAYGCTYSDETFISGFTSNMRRYNDPEPQRNDDYSCVFYSDGTVKSTKDGDAYNNEAGIDAIAIYQPETNKRSAGVTIRLNTSHLSKLTKTRLNTIIGFARDQSEVLYIADGKTFRTTGAALSYLNDKPTISSNEDFETLFDEITNSAITIGKQKEYTGDVIYMTTDGKIYNLAVDMAAWHTLAQAKNYPSILGNYTQDIDGSFITDNPEGITYDLSRLLDDKKVVRLYRTGDTWNAYGVTNKVQDVLIRELGAKRMNKTSYIKTVENRDLFVNKNDGHVEIHGKDWTNKDFALVEWSGDKWYKAIRKIMSSYNIATFDDFKKLGFSNDFILRLKSSFGKERINKRTGEKYLTRGGIDYQYILEYIGDNSNTSLSRNIIIENTPDATRANESGDWKNNVHIKTIEDANIYLDKLIASGMLLENDEVVYENWAEFEKATAAIRHDPLLVDANTYNAKAIEKAQTLLGRGELIIRLLNADSFVHGRGLDISKDGFKIASSIILRGVENKKSKEVSLTYQGEDGKETEKVASTVLNPEELVLAKDKVDPTIKEFADLILETRNIEDAKYRDETLDELFQATKLPRYKDIDMSAIRNIIANERNSTKRSIERQNQIKKNIDRVDAYNKLEKDSPEQLSERRKLIRYYEQLRNFRQRLVAVEGGTEYYDSLLKSVSKVGGFQSRMAQNFSHAYGRYEEIVKNVSDEQREVYDRQLTKIQNYRKHFITNYDTDTDVIHMEYPGYYEHYELLYNMLRNWLDGKKAIEIDYLNGNAKFETPKTFAAAQTEIVDYINKWSADTEFRRSLATRERVSSYTRIKSLRGASYSQEDLQMFKDIPDDIKDISEFPKEAIDFYNDFMDDPDDLANVLNNAEFVTDLTREYGDDYVYNLQRLYNELITPDISDFRSEAKKDMFMKIRAGAAVASGKSEEQVKALKENIEKRMTKPSYAKVRDESRKIKSNRLVGYRQRRGDYLLRIYDTLAAGDPVTDEEISKELKEVGKQILSHTWIKKTKDGYREIRLSELNNTQKYKVITGIVDAYYTLLGNPKTDRSLLKFENDIDTVLSEMKINRTIPGDTKRALLTIGKPPEGLDIDADYIKERLGPVMRGEVKAVKDEYATLASFRDKAYEEEAVLEAIVEEFDTPLDKLIRQYKFWRKNLYRRAPVTVISADKYNVVFNTDTKRFEDPAGRGLDESKVDPRRLTTEEFDKYFNYKIYEGLEKGYLEISKGGHILDKLTRRIRVYSHELPKTNKYYKEYKSSSLKLEDDEDLTNIPEDSNEIPDESDFDDTMTSSSIEDPGYFEPITIEKKTEKKVHGSWSEDKVTSIDDPVIRKLLSYQPKPGEDGEFIMSTKEFNEDNAVFINEFRNSPDTMEDFVSWVESNPSIPINSSVEALIFALLNQIRTVTTISQDLYIRADNLVEGLRSRSGRILGMAKSTGLTPVDQMLGFISQMIELTTQERATLEMAAQLQRNAIKVQDYKAADMAMQKVLEIAKKHQSELPTSCNIFAKGLTNEERTTRMHNILEKITSWRYFAMLGAPSTFFTKNIASNIIITGMDKLAEFIASKLSKDVQLSQDYKINEADVIKIFGEDQTKNFYKQEYGNLVTEYTKKNGVRPVSEAEIETIEKEASHRATTLENQRRKPLVLLNEDQAEGLIKVSKEDAEKINLRAFSKYINDFIRTRHSTDGKMPSTKQITNKANEYIMKNFGQYTMDMEVSDEARNAVAKMLIDNGLIDAIMNDTVSKYERGYDIKLGALRQLTLDADGKLDDISEKEASILTSTLNKNAPFKWELLNKYYRFIFRTMDLGDKKFMRPKIISTVEKLVASNMTAAEIQDLLAGKSAARARFEDFVAYATNDAMKTYFREDTDFYKKLIQLFPKNPTAQLILGTLIPFPRMVINTMNTALSYSPVGFIKALLISKNGVDAFTKLKINKELGKAITGSALITVGAILAASGLIGFDDDDKYGGAQIVIGDKLRIALGDLAPSAIPLIIGASITHGATEGFWAAATDGANALLDATILGEAINIFGGNQDAATFVANSFTSYINQFVPSVFRHVARTIDPAKKDYSSNKAIKVLQRTAASIPLVSFAVPNEIDPYTGDAVYQNADANKGWAHILSFFNALSPAKTTLDIESDVEIESKAVGAPTTGPTRTYNIDGIEYTIPDNVYKDYQVLRAKLYSTYARQIINTKSYQNMSLTQKKSKLKQLQNKATQEARKQLNIGK